MSTEKLVREQLGKLVSWGDELGELQALDSFLGDAVVNISEGDGFEAGSDSVKGLYLFCVELSRRIRSLKAQMQRERQHLQSLLEQPR